MPETGAGGHGLLGGEGQEKAAYGGKADGPHGYSDRDQKDLKAGGPDIPPDVALPPHVHTHQKEDQTESHGNKGATVGGQGLGNKEVPGQNAADNGADDPLSHSLPSSCSQLVRF